MELFVLQVKMLIKHSFQVLEFPCLKISQKAKHKGKSKECLLSFRYNALFIEKLGRELFSGWKMLGWKIHGPIIPFPWKLTQEWTPSSCQINAICLIKCLSETIP